MHLCGQRFGYQTGNVIFEHEKTHPDLNKHVKYPDVAVTKKIEGAVVVQFKVLKDETVADISVIKSVDKSLNNDALRVLREMPEWEPALLAGVPIESYKKQPIVFKF